MKKLKLHSTLFLLSFSIALSLEGCANRGLISPVAKTSPLLTHRWLAFGGIIILAFVKVGIMEGKKAQSGTVWASQNTIATLINILLCWTKLGEWGYLISKWIFNFWKPLTPITNFLLGFQGNITGVAGVIMLFGFVFPNPELFYWSAIPALLGLVINTLYLSVVPNNNGSNNN
jgi:hypothetical protein